MQKYRITTTYDGLFKIQERIFLFFWKDCMLQVYCNFNDAQFALNECIKRDKFKPFSINIPQQIEPKIKITGTNIGPEPWTNYYNTNYNDDYEKEKKRKRKRNHDTNPMNPGLPPGNMP